MLKGETVVLVNKIQTGVNRFREPIYKEKEIAVDNVLIAPTSSDDMPTEYHFDGKKTVYTLAIPKGDTNHWKDQVVKFWGESWRVIGEPTRGIEKLIPLNWNMKVMVERYE